MFGWQVKAIAAALVVAAITALIARDHIRTKRLNQYKRDIATLTQTIEHRDLTIATMQADAQLNKETENALYEKLAGITASRRPISVRCEPATAAAVPSEGGAAAGTDAASIDGGHAGPLRDVGAALEDARIELETNNARFEALQAWEAARTH